MDLESLSLRHLRYLRAVAAGASFSDAAEQVGVSQSALSQGLARLEDLAGTVLFEPDGRRRRLTESGRMLAAYANQVLGETAQITDRLRARSEGSGGTLRIAMIDAAALYLFAGRMERFRRRHDGVRLRITVAGSGACLALLRAFEADVAIVVAPAIGFDTRALGSEPFHVYGPSTTPTAADPWLLYPAGSHTRALIDRALAGRGISPSIVGESGNPAVLRQLAVLMAGWTVLPAAVGGAEQAAWRRGREITRRQIVGAVRPGSSDQLAQVLLDELES